MTAEEAENNEPPAIVTNVLPTEITDIFEYLSHNSNIIFKSQQIDDPELQITEKKEIAQEIYMRNRQTFLMRFGSYLEERHLSSFAHLAISDGAASLNKEESCEEMQMMLFDFKNRLQTRRKDVKNRRYAAMQVLIKQNEYFSEQEMMQRAPELYQELIGQYLSVAEKKQRDSYDVRNTTFSGILMHTLQQKQMEDTLRQADIVNECKQRTNDTEDDSTDSNSSSSQHEDIEIPDSFRRQWGNFENEDIACSTSRVEHNSQVKEKSIPAAEPAKTNEFKYITAGERDLLRQEFVGIMHANFLAGNDKDFDYSQVDNDTQLDDLRQLNQDKEDAYFEESDEDDVDAVHLIQRTESAGSEESDDELDIFMNHLSKHHSLLQ